MWDLRGVLAGALSECGVKLRGRQTSRRRNALEDEHSSILNEAQASLQAVSGRTGDGDSEEGGAL